MKFAAIVVLALATGASSLAVKSQCGPQTQVCTAAFRNAAQEPQWECKVVVDGGRVAISDEESGNGAVVCGPGKFTFSAMQCSGDHFDYHTHALEVDSSSWSGGTNCPGAGQTVDFPHSMACYSVEC